MKSLVPPKPQRAGSRSIEVSSAYLQGGQAISRSLWVRVSPSHPLLKLVMVPPIIVAAVAMLILIALILGFILLALVLLRVLSRPRREGSERK